MTRSLGGPADSSDEPSQLDFELPSAPSYLVLCSDGLWNYLPDAVSLAVLIRGQPAEADALARARSLVKFALNAADTIISLSPYSCVRTDPRTLRRIAILTGSFRFPERCLAERSSMTAFSGQVSQNQYLAQGADLVHAVMSVTSSLATAAEAAIGSSNSGRRPRQTLVEALIVDCSGSMGGEKIRQTRLAVSQAIDLLHPEAWFCVIAGTDTGKVCVPLTQATPENRLSAQEGSATPRLVRPDGDVHLAANRTGRIAESPTASIMLCC